MSKKGCWDAYDTLGRSKAPWNPRICLKKCVPVHILELLPAFMITLELLKDLPGTDMAAKSAYQSRMYSFHRPLRLGSGDRRSRVASELRRHAVCHRPVIPDLSKAGCQLGGYMLA
jgi:hypothetical protein